MSFHYNYYPEHRESLDRCIKNPVKWSMLIIPILAVLIMVGVTVFFFSWLGVWAWVFMWPWLIILHILSDLL